MNPRGAGTNRISAIPPLVVLAAFCVAAPLLRGQDAPPAGDTDPAAATAQADASARAEVMARADIDAAPTPADASTTQAAALTAADAPATPDAAPAATDASPAAPADATSGSPAATGNGTLYYNQPGQPPTYGEPSFGILQRLPSSELGTPQYGVPYSSVLNGQSLDPLTGKGFGVDFYDFPKAGNAEGSLSLGSVGIGLTDDNFLRRAVAPEDADLKIGPLYFYLDSLTGSLLYTDNSHLSATNRQSETLAIISLNMTLLVQLTEDLQFSISGSLIYLPIQNILGFESSSLEGGLGFLLAALPTLTANATYDILVAEWPVRFRDSFTTSTGSYSDSTRDSFSLFEGSALQQQNGKYVFRSARVGLRNNEGDNNANSQNDYFSFFTNTISASTQGYLPSDILLSSYAERSDLWYNQGNRGLPTSREDFYVLAQSVRPTLRFKPFASYEISHTSDAPGVFQQVEAGFSGPITDQLFLLTDMGYFLSNTGNEGLVWRLDLQHLAGENTTEDFSFQRDWNDFDDEMITTEYYRITQVLGPTINGAGFADHTSYEEVAGSGAVNRDQEDFGAGIYWILGPLTKLAVQGEYTHQNFDDHFRTDTWTARVNLSRTISDSMHLEAFYQYQNYMANESDRNYYENLVYISFTKTFH